MNFIFNKDYHSYTEEEIIFLDELHDTMKFQSFVYGFSQSYNPINLYKNSLAFTEEFLSIISRKKEQLSKKNIKYYPNNKNLIKYFSGKMEKENEKLKMKIYKKI